MIRSLDILVYGHCLSAGAVHVSRFVTCLGEEKLLVQREHVVMRGWHCVLILSQCSVTRNTLQLFFSWGIAFVAVWDDSLVLSFQLPAFSFPSWQGVACLDEDYYYKFGFGME